MTLKSQRQLENTKAKLRQLEEHYQRRKEDVAEDSHVRELTLQSLKRTINQMKEEIIRYEAHTRAQN